MNNNSLQLFEYSGHEVRTQLVDDEPWFNLNDVCSVLDISNVGNVASRLDESDIRTMDVRSGGQMRAMKFTNEPGLYDVAFMSRKPEARDFKRWVTREVLPAIRKTGSFVAKPKSLAEQALEVISGLQELAAEQAKELEVARPLAAQAKTYREADGLRTLTDLTNDLKVHAASNYPGRKVLRDDVFDLAGELGLIIRGNTVRHNQPTARAIESGWVKPKSTVVETNSHGKYTKMNAHLTNRGYGRVWDEAVTRMLNNQPIFVPKNKEVA